MDYPPSIVPSVSATLVPNQVKVLNLDALTNPDGGLTQLSFEMTVRDPNVDQRLTAHAIINQSVSNPTPAIIPLLDVPTSNDVERPYLVTLDASLVATTVGCKKVEIWVSSDFSGARTSVHQGDIASITYWFAVSDGMNPVDMMRCM